MEKAGPDERAGLRDGGRDEPGGGSQRMTRKYLASAVAGSE